MAVTPEDFCERRLQILQACRDMDLGALAIFANGGCFGLSGISQGYMSFLCGWNSYDSPCALILREGQRPHLIVAHHRMQMMALKKVSGVDVSWIDQNSLGTGIRKLLASTGALPKRLGVCGWEDVIAKTWKNIEAELSASEFVDISKKFIPLRAAKSPRQLEMHQEGARICDGMYGYLAGMRVVGRHTYQIKAELESFAKDRGCEFVQHWMTVGNPPDYPRYFHDENRQIAKAGDMLLYGVTLTLDGVWAHAVRCFRLGPPDPRLQRIQSKVVEYQQKFVSLMKPGADMAEVVKIGFQYTASIYDEIAQKAVTMLRLGHSMGYSYTEPGVSDAFPRSYYPLESELQRPSPGKLEKGMVFQIHPIFFYSDGAAGIGDMIAIEDHGGEFMTHYPRAVGSLRV
jgi:Xaa-Pro aminopeptidase